MHDTSVERQDTAARFCRDFAEELRSRGISLRGAAERVHWSKSAIGKACTGPGLPSRDLVEDVLNAIGLAPERVQDWMLRHATLSMAATAAADDPGEGDDAPAGGVEPPGPVTGVRRRTVAVVAVVAALLGAAVAGGLALLAGGDAQPVAAAPVPSAVVTVQNKIALGASELVEDTGPAYLSSRPAAFCATKGCKVQGTEISSGALLAATCTARGDMMWNYNLDSPAAENPHRAKSDLWYQVSWPDGRTGYLSEVYVDPASRGSLGLPSCDTQQG
ncbi:helix-turn-helix domain-containing protein [Pseudonocardia sp. RS010]|uniref:helix-turn-helix domain-containing protein n=1 Tax=Pseudonocardia sp. RS010 TaxID=3385979 RepID=UPI00399F1201